MVVADITHLGSKGKPNNKRYSGCDRHENNEINHDKGDRDGDDEEEDDYGDNDDEKNRPRRRRQLGVVPSPQHWRPPAGGHGRRINSNPETSGSLHGQFSMISSTIISPIEMQGFLHKGQRSFLKIQFRL